jgi:hypothetical protein
MNPYDATAPEPRGMSGTTKVLLAFGIGCGLLLVLCCGVFGIGGYFATNYAKDSFSDDPEKARQITAEIVDIDIPESLEPQGSMDARVPFRGDRLMSGAAYGSKEGDNHIIIGEFGPSIAQGDFEQTMRESMREAGREDDENLEIINSETYDAMIHGEEATFTISEAKGRRTEKEYWQVSGQFHGAAGPAIIIMRLEAEKFDKEQVIDIIKSMEDAPTDDVKDEEKPADAPKPVEETPEDTPAAAQE